jgi:hypothetical protein
VHKKSSVENNSIHHIALLVLSLVHLESACVDPPLKAFDADGLEVLKLALRVAHSSFCSYRFSLMASSLSSLKLSIVIFMNLSVCLYILRSRGLSYFILTKATFCLFLTTSFLALVTRALSIEHVSKDGSVRAGRELVRVLLPLDD